MSSIFTFIGGSKGPWSVKKITGVKGQPIAEVSALRIVESDVREKNSEEKWLFKGFTSNTRYATSDEVASLKKLQPEIGRKEATCAAMILVKKSDSWWQLAQDQRRKIFEEQSHHNSIGMDYLPAVARRLHHSRDLGEEFDFITWFEFAPSDIPKFDELVDRLRASEEWTYVEREVDVRLEQGQEE
ncbi:MAG: chlorite dismutase family protein [Candidatus Obscuribacter sp.]|nr:chlorite dismutase family protein [Candidatus Obscuribacter sp.]